MAETNIYFNPVDSEDDLCFTCAVLRIIKDNKVKINIESTDFEFNKCDDCDTFIHHKITI
jgi:hypothetical protein